MWLPKRIRDFITRVKNMEKRILELERLNYRCQLDLIHLY